MGKKIFVGGLSWGTKEQDLHQGFSRFGDITEARVITDRDTGRSRGFGFITFEQEDAVQQAIDEMDGKEFDGRVIKVDRANERGPRGGGGGGGGGRDRW